MADLAWIVATILSVVISRSKRARNGRDAAELTIMTRLSALEGSFDIAWSFLKKSGELRGAVESANIIMDSIEQQLRAGERRKLMLANRAISSYREQVTKAPDAGARDREVIWLY